jgi:hypothetical protein
MSVKQRAMEVICVIVRIEYCGLEENLSEWH